MRCRVYRNLDRPFTLLGIKGWYIPIAGAGLLGIIILSMIVGSIAGTFVGLATAVALIVSGYLALTEIQQRFGEKALARRMAGMRLPKFILVRSKVWSR